MVGAEVPDVEPEQSLTDHQLVIPAELLEQTHREIEVEFLFQFPAEVGKVGDVLKDTFIIDADFNRMEAAFLSEMERVYRRKLGGTTGGDVFRLQAVAGLLDLIQGYFDKCDDKDRARRLRLESEKIQKALDKLKK